MISTIFARLNCGRNSTEWMSAAKKRLEIVLVMWDDDWVMRLEVKFPAEDAC
ncbi:MAG TPA: hypothetical protein VEX69_04140 [Candidatus Limnocylindria bacterium]|nr:hypothetical protein [Candidatus Limnocylindria bacterium]